MKFKVGDAIQRKHQIGDVGVITSLDLDGYYVRWENDPKLDIRAHSFGYIETNFELNKKITRNKFLKDLLK